MKVRLLRGQVVVREIKSNASAILFTPTPDPRSVKTHRGLVLQIGAPALAYEKAPVPYGFDAGDEVVFHFEDHEEKRTRLWVDGKPAIWLMQREIDAVVEPVE